MQSLFGLQGLRFISAMLVVVMHATEAIAQRMGTHGGWKEGGVGVDIFFVISGFVMMLTTPDAAPGSTLTSRWGDARHFMLKRIVRVVPLYWFYLCLKIALVLLLPSMAYRTVIVPEHVAASFLFFPSTAPWGLVQPVLPVGWTLNCEMFFYVIFAVAVCLGAQKLVFCTLVFLALNGLSSVMPESVPLTFYTQGIVWEFVFGMAIGWMYRQRLQVPTYLAALAVMLGVVLVFFMQIDEAWGRVLGWGTGAALIVFGVVFSESLISRLLPVKPMGFAGDTSYSIYLVHAFAVPACMALLMKFAAFPPLAVVVMTVVASALAGFASYVFIERPITRYARKVVLGSS